MKKALALMLTLCLAASLAACGGPSDEEIKAIRNVSFEGKELTVTLGANRSTGYEWDYEICGECIEPLPGRTFKVTGSKGDATGEEITGFEGMSAGRAVIVFTTPNGWDGTGEGDGYTVNVIVGADGTIEKANGMDGAFPGETAPEPAAESASEPDPESAPEPEPKTSIAIAELADGTYTGTLSGVEITTGADDIEAVMYTAVLPADITVTIENGQITLYCEATASAYAVINDEETPRTNDYSMILSGSLPLEQSGDVVIARGEVSALGESAVAYHTDGKFDRWEIEEREEGAAFTCDVQIAMENNIPVATITVGKRSVRTAAVPLALVLGTKDTGSGEPLSAPYAEMLKSGDYRYSYPLVYGGLSYIATVATYNGMICSRLVADDGEYSQRVVTIDGNAWTVDELTGDVVDGGAESAETLPDYGSSLTFVASKTLETGAIADAYDFEHGGEKWSLVFLFAPEGKLVSLIASSGENTNEIEILDFRRAGNDPALFDAPQ